MKRGRCYWMCGNSRLIREMCEYALGTKDARLPLPNVWCLFAFYGNRQAFKAKKYSLVRDLSKAIKAELWKVNAAYVQALLENRNCRDTWNMMFRFCGLKTKETSPAANVEDLNRQFSNTETVIPTPFTEVFPAPNGVSLSTDQNEVFKTFNNLSLIKHAVLMDCHLLSSKNVQFPFSLFSPT